MKGRIILFVLDMKIGAVLDRPTQSVRITFVCRSKERRRLILAIRVHLAGGGYNCAPRVTRRTRGLVIYSQN